MANWNDIMKEVQDTTSQYDIIRRKYLKELSDYTKRNVLIYYSGWLKKPGAPNADINDGDMEGFMTCINGMDCSNGLDLILHTPGGSPTAAEAIVSYLRSKFKRSNNNSSPYDIRVIVPHLAMSAGTMIACSAKEIIMGRQSSLGPIDPQFNGIPAYNILNEFLEAKKDLSKNPNNVQYWGIKLKQYPAAFMQTAFDAIRLSDELVDDWLGTCMFDRNDPNQEPLIKKIVSKLNDHGNSKVHDRHFDAKFCQDIGLKIEMLENDNDLQDKVLSVHHACMITIDGTSVIKLIENQDGKAFISSLPMMPIMPR